MSPTANKRLDAYREWSANRNYHLCRLVHYCGVDMVGAENVAHTEIETEIEHLTNEGFFVDWQHHGDRLILCVWEHGGPAPDWEFVIDERPLVDIEQILRQSRE